MVNLFIFTLVHMLLIYLFSHLFMIKFMMSSIIYKYQFLYFAFWKRLFVTFWTVTWVEETRNNSDKWWQRGGVKMCHFCVDAIFELPFSKS